jgi:hypothetical protein
MEVYLHLSFERGVKASAYTLGTLDSRQTLILSLTTERRRDVSGLNEVKAKIHSQNSNSLNFAAK